ncbi:MAG: hypothetical protein ACI4TA_08575 [Acetatifactor sp.]
MRNALFRAICKVGIFVICAQAVVHFRPREAYEKYLKLLVGIMVMIQLFLPIAAFFLGGNMEQLAQRLEGFQEELEQNAKLEAEAAMKADEVLQRMTLEEVSRRMEELKRKEQETEQNQTQQQTQEQVQEEKDTVISVEVEPIESVIIE